MAAVAVPLVWGAEAPTAGDEGSPCANDRQRLCSQHNALHMYKLNMMLYDVISHNLHAERVSLLAQ